MWMAYAVYNDASSITRIDPHPLRQDFQNVPGREDLPDHPLQAPLGQECVSGVGGRVGDVNELCAMWVWDHW